MFAALPAPPLTCRGSLWRFNTVTLPIIALMKLYRYYTQNRPVVKQSPLLAAEKAQYSAPASSNAAKAPSRAQGTA